METNKPIDAIELEKRIIESVKKVMNLTDDITYKEACEILMSLAKKGDTRKTGLFLDFFNASKKD